MVGQPSGLQEIFPTSSGGCRVGRAVANLFPSLKTQRPGLETRK